MPLRLLCLLLAAASLLAAKTPTILLTDLGDDIDDTWALAHVLRSPELDLQLVVSDYGHAEYRTALAAKLLQAAGRTEVAVGQGTDGTFRDPEKLNQTPWLAGYKLDSYPGKHYKDGASAVIEFIHRAKEPVTVIAIGPTPTLAAVVQRDPTVAAKCRLVGMHGSFDIGYGGKTGADAEWNVRADVASLRTVFAAPWQDILLTPLDTCGNVQLDGDHYRRIWQAAPTDTLLEAVIQNYCVWAPRVEWMTCDFFTQRSTTLFDDVAVYLAYAQDLVEIETLKFTITDDGKTARDSNGPFTARVALRWKDKAAFERHLAERLLGQ